METRIGGEEGSRDGLFEGGTGNPISGQSLTVADGGCRLTN